MAGSGMPSGDHRGRGINPKLRQNGLTSKLKRSRADLMRNRAKAERSGAEPKQSQAKPKQSRSGTARSRGIAETN